MEVFMSSTFLKKFKIFERSPITQHINFIVIKYFSAKHYILLF